MLILLQRRLLTLRCGQTENPYQPHYIEKFCHYFKVVLVLMVLMVDYSLKLLGQMFVLIQAELRQLEQYIYIYIRFNLLQCKKKSMTDNCYLIGFSTTLQNSYRKTLQNYNPPSLNEISIINIYFSLCTEYYRSDIQYTCRIFQKIAHMFNIRKDGSSTKYT